MPLFSFGKKDKKPPELPDSVAKTPANAPKIQNPPAPGSSGIKPPQLSGLMPATGLPAGTATTQPMVMPRAAGAPPLAPRTPSSATRSTQRIVLPTAASSGKLTGTRSVSSLGRINLPIGMILRCLPPEVLAADISEFEASGAASTEIGLPMNTVLSQLPSGKVEMPLNDLVPHFPPGYLQPTESISSYLPMLVSLPLMDVVMRIPPDLLALRPDQKDVDASVINMADPFTEEILREQAEAAQRKSQPNIIDESQVPAAEEFVPRDQAAPPVKSFIPPPRPSTQGLPSRQTVAPAAPVPVMPPIPVNPPQAAFPGSGSLPSVAARPSPAPPQAPNSTSRKLTPTGGPTAGRPIIVSRSAGAATMPVSLPTPPAIQPPPTSSTTGRLLIPPTVQTPPSMPRPTAILPTPPGVQTPPTMPRPTASLPTPPAVQAPPTPTRPTLLPTPPGIQPPPSMPRPIGNLPMPPVVQTPPTPEARPPFPPRPTQPAPQAPPRPLAPIAAVPMPAPAPAKAGEPDAGVSELQRLAALAMGQSGEPQADLIQPPPADAAPKAEPVSEPIAAPAAEPPPAPIAREAPPKEPTLIAEAIAVAAPLVPAAVESFIPQPPPPVVSASQRLAAQARSMASRSIATPEARPLTAPIPGPGPRATAPVAAAVPTPAAPTPPAAEQAPTALNLNSCTVADLIHIPGCTQLLAESIVRHREKVGSFRKIEDLLDVPGMNGAAYTSLTGEAPPVAGIAQSVADLLGFPPEQKLALKDITDRISCWPDVSGCVLGQSTGLSLVGAGAESLRHGGHRGVCPAYFRVGQPLLRRDCGQGDRRADHSHHRHKLPHFSPRRSLSHHPLPPASNA